MGLSTTCLHHSIISILRMSCVVIVPCGEMKRKIWYGLIVLISLWQLRKGHQSVSRRANGTQYSPLPNPIHNIIFVVSTMQHNHHAAIPFDSKCAALAASSPHEKEEIAIALWRNDSCLIHKVVVDGDSQSTSRSTSIQKYTSRGRTKDRVPVVPDDASTYGTRPPVSHNSTIATDRRARELKK